MSRTRRAEPPGAASSAKASPGRARREPSARPADFAGAGAAEAIEEFERLCAGELEALRRRVELSHGRAPSVPALGALPVRRSALAPARALGEIAALSAAGGSAARARLADPADAKGALRAALAAGLRARVDKEDPESLLLEPGEGMAAALSEALPKWGERAAQAMRARRREVKKALPQVDWTPRAQPGRRLAEILEAYEAQAKDLASPMDRGSQKRR